MKKYLGPFVRFAVSALLITYVCTLIQFRDIPLVRFTLRSGESVAGVEIRRAAGKVVVRPPAAKAVTLDLAQVTAETTDGVQAGFLTILRGLDLRIYLPVSLIWFVPLLIDVERWRVLLRVQGIRIGYFDALRLTYIGIFLSNVLPGVTGGDVAKAVILAPSTRRKTRMVTCVFADRVVGLIALACLAAFVILLNIRDPHFHEPAQAVTIFLVGFFGFFTLYYNRRLRATSLFTWVRDKMPGHQIVREIDEAVRDFGSARRALAWTFVLSLGAHGATMLAGYGFGQALGIHEAHLAHYFSFVPLIAIAASIPISISGWGVAEAGYSLLFATVGVPETQAITLAILGRLTTIAYSLPGGLFLMFGKARYAVTETGAGAEEDKAAEPRPNAIAPALDHHVEI